MEKSWTEMTSLEKRQARFDKWMNPKDVEWESIETEKAYKARVTRLIDAICLEKTPDRIPLFPFYTFLPADLAGMSNKEVMYDADKAIEAWKKYIYEFEPDAYLDPVLASSGKVLDILGYELYKWPGRGIPDNVPYQCLEKDYMKADEYDALMEDPSGFFQRLYLPRIMKSLGPLSDLAPFTGIMELPHTVPHFIPYGLPHVREAMQALLDAGEEALAWAGKMDGFVSDVTKKGYVNGLSAVVKAPFDFIGDTLRGTHGMMMDMYRQPEKVEAAVEKLVPIMIKEGVAGPNRAGNPVVFMPLHKGADGFMSDEQFKRFYWPTLKAVILGLVDEGCVPMIFAEGGYNQRLEYLAELPKGKTIWLFDRTDMEKAKEVIGGNICMAGNVPASLMISASVEELRAYCEKLIKTAGKGGGFIMSCGTSLDEAKKENLVAMCEITRELGVY